MAILDITDNSTFTISARMGPKESSRTIVLGNRFSGNAEPVLVIQELSPNPENNRIYLEDLSGFINTEDEFYLIKE